MLTLPTPSNLDTVRLAYTYAELRAMSADDLNALQQALGLFVEHSHPRKAEARLLNDAIRDVRLDGHVYGWERYR